ncbi:accessory gene regulator B family protein [Serpentinicella sp. ANB-PHB4]|uniref:accessory gene regulator ArgB-like protein n=1 Tax=Serpentinicella sp. ANB-PHB4 TaxID=3074076 RepID=UPI002867272B|nr:accessory gene regulator B family protein [Serpentinicella sp. ANB-PHB4]MDR5658810.1 accessory gene regulator B family protein [Serpentinicella sp. ANB-PHB4]
MVQKLSDSISSYICHELKYSDEKRGILSYGLQVFLGEFLKFITIFVFAYILNIFKSTTIVVVTFILFRRKIGGSHCDTFNKCFVYSTFLMLLLGFFSKVIVIPQQLLLSLIITLYLMGILITIKWVPMGTEKKSIKNPELRKKIKKKTILLLTTWFIVILFVQKSGYDEAATSSLGGIMLAFFLATPLGKKVTSFEI